MRYIKDIVHPAYKISVYHWNGKYIIKIEAGGVYEQIYKIDETEILATEELDKIADSQFIQKVTDRFREMHEDFTGSLRRNEIIFD
jgi:hypothetical protein